MDWLSVWGDVMRAVIVAILAMVPLAAKADWQYSKWGMNPAQVIEAARGAATPFQDSSETADQRSKVVAPYQSGRHTFRSRFVFDRSDRLSIVMLELSDPSRCPELYADLTQAYGPPQAKSPQGYFPKWWDRKNGNVVTLVDMVRTICSIQYMPLGEAGTPGGL
ncbi:hypothetical protein DWF00_27135 [Bosea caraganae]|uniref:Uncharacterized protein n=1 Tax=Bosea caraganae TaxID=2763117 RepID=A0A370L9R7_9HYPH|nr:hypothetical protein DWF00_27135 [Bosea caraganae]RDJ27969.1 hypothetical protein DWE98_05020 [Bosea caraganae]